MFYQDRLWTGVRKNSKKTRYGTLKTDHRAAGGGKEMPFLAPIFHFKRSFYQDRPGTNIGKALSK
eukprot:COSAG06_NODE_70152_length_193_cov_124.712766_1_plen_64_part_11